MKLYLAGPIFSEADQEWLRKTKKRILEIKDSNGEGLFEVVWPYELLDKDSAHALGAKARTRIFEMCRSTLDECDALVALLDGSQVDDGTAWEIGYFYAKNGGNRIIGIRTDFRRAGETEVSTVNAMIDCSCRVIVDSIDGLLRALNHLHKH